MKWNLNIIKTKPKSNKMRNEICKVVNLQKFFNIKKSTNSIVKYNLEKPSQILLQNVHSNWLQSLYSKTYKNITVFLSSPSRVKKIPFGYISQKLPEYSEVLEHDLNDCTPKRNSELKFSLVIPEQDVMQYFIQWQRYRKYWWSSITTTPSVFSIDDIKYGDTTAEVNIVAKFPWGQETVETITISSEQNEVKDTSTLSCSMILENALFILLLDALTSSTKEGYLRLHRMMAPYQISFAIDEETNKEKTLINLATLLHHRLMKNGISNLLPDFSLPMESQVKDNLQLGVAYTAVLSERTLENGIFQLLNSSTMLKEQIHVADFDNYAALLCGKLVPN